MQKKKETERERETDGEKSSACPKDTDIKGVVFLLLGYKAEWHPCRQKMGESLCLGRDTGYTQRDFAVGDQSAKYVQSVPTHFVSATHFVAF